MALDTSGQGQIRFGKKVRKPYISLHKKNVLKNNKNHRIGIPGTNTCSSRLVNVKATHKNSGIADKNTTENHEYFL